MELSDEQFRRYARHLILDEVGEETLRWFRIPWDAVMDGSKVTPVQASAESSRG